MRERVSASEKTRLVTPSDDRPGDAGTPAAQESLQRSTDGKCVSKLALPKRQHLPAERPKLTLHPDVSRPVALDLLRPVAAIRDRHTSAARAVVAVPEAPMHEDRLAPTGKHKIGAARQVASMKTESIPFAVSESSHSQLDRRIRAPDGLHRAPSNSGNLGHDR
jgi:hypothetical protein